MKVFYYKAQGGNVGDDLNAALWQHLLPELASLDAARWLIGIGTILDERLNQLEGRKIVMGSGLRPGRRMPVFSGDIRFAAVRGKLTAQRLGLGAEVALGDPGFLIGSLVETTPAIQPTDRVALIPHVYSERWSRIANTARDAGLDVISPTLSLDDFVAQLRTCSRVYCESLHAAIFADALRIPWARVRISSHYYEGDGVSDFKWRDAFSIVDLDTQSAVRESLIPLRRSWLRPVQAIAERRLVRALLARRDDSGLFRLSNAATLHERTSALLSCVMQLRSADAVAHWPGTTALSTTAEPPLRVLIQPKNVDNPYVRRFATELEDAGATVDEFSYLNALSRRYDVLHLHWPDSHLVSGSWWTSLAKHARFAAAIGLMRLRGTRIVWMMHNLKPHDANHRLSAWLFPRWVPRACTQVIALSAHGLQAARTLYPSLERKPAVIVPHCHYRGEYPPAPSREECRRRLGLLPEHFTYLFFGNIRRYKNVPHLIGAFRALPQRDIQLVIAGLPGHGVDADDLVTLTGDDERISLRLEFIQDEAVPTYFGAADVVVLPFDSILNSGSVMLALSFDRIAMAPRLGALPEIQSRVGSQWLRLYDGTLTTAMLQDLRADAMRKQALHADLSAFDWNSIADRTLEFYRQGAGGAGATRPASTEGDRYETPGNEYSKS
ncbi:MAG TPA: glycosyltransferase [Povalibacter sp.]|nr:glycosyltransferase [Povalibacter sp.]